MKRDVMYSLILHVVIISLTVVTFPLTHKTIDPGQVIRVSLSAGFPSPVQAAVPVPVQQPAAKPVAPVVKPQPKNDAKSLPTTKTTKPATKAKPKDKGVRPGEDASSLAKEYKNEIETASTQAGSPFAGAAIDNPNFDYPDWFDLAFHKIQTNWSNPVNVDGTIICVVYFQVIRSGRVIEARVEQQSGIDMFDQACVAAIQRSNPFPPLPNDFAEEIIGITLPFKYDPTLSRGN
ncbi:MAG: TonB family protein [Candidatus Zixiibacteriota bacterium]